MATGTTFGWLNGLKSYIRRQDLGDGMKEFSVMETTIIPYGGRHGAFSAKGDSGSTILDRTGRIVGLITIGAGLNGEIEVTFATPAYELWPLIMNAFPGVSLLPEVDPDHHIYQSSTRRRPVEKYSYI